MRISILLFLFLINNLFANEDKNYKLGLNALMQHKYQKASNYLMKACNDRNANGCYNLAVMYHFGKGVKRDYGVARELYRQACNKQYIWACSNLGAILEPRLR